MSQKIIELEEKLSHFEHHIEALDRVLFHQTQKIEELELLIQHLANKINAEKENAPSVIETPPPHY